jgi:Mn2+/Fe2+ NRAMP family transporter
MTFSSLVGFFIIVATATALNAHGVTNIDTAAQAASALRPLAGELAFALFAGGVIGTGLLAIPVLTGSAAYAVAEALGLRGSLESPAHRARGFYAILSIATVAGSALAAIGLDPIAMLFWAAVINGIAAVPIMVVMMLLVSRRRGVRIYRIPGWLRALGWLSAALMAVVVTLFWIADHVDSRLNPDLSRLLRLGLALGHELRDHAISGLRTNSACLDGLGQGEAP